MSYTINTDATVSDLAGDVAALLAQNKVFIDGIGDELIAAGTLVTLDDNSIVWCSCIIRDLPETPQIDFITIAFQVSNGAARRKTNGQVVGIATWRSVFAEHLDTWTVPTIRRACLMIALGEPQPQVPIPVPVEGGPTEQDLFPLPDMDKANGSIRSAIAAADQIAAPLTNVL
jgi:hypothetical protein